MGSQYSSEERNVKCRSLEEKPSSAVIHEHIAPDIQKMKSTPGPIDESRLVELMQALQRIARLRREATSASVNARQKKREASFKRQDVWVSDGKLMGEIQRLAAQGKFDGFEELVRLAAGCQMARDGLGPLEQEGIEAEQQWEGHTWRLRQAEEQLYSEFAHEFEIADSYSAPSTSATSSPYESASEPESEILEGEVHVESAVPFPRATSRASSGFALDPEIERTASQLEEPASSILLGLGGPEPYPHPTDSYSPDSDSGIGDIDEDIGNRSGGDLVDLPTSVQKSHYTSIELYPQLLTEFVSRRDRINKWLENSVLLSHIEGTSLFTILKDQLETENHRIPSNWSQLVMAYWELDGAATPHSRQPASIPDRQKSKIPQKASDISGGPSHSDSQPTFGPINLQSRGSSNADHGYFSDNASKNRETWKGFVPLRPPPPPPRRPQTNSSAGGDHIRQENQPP
jgi:hypothetical protein